MPVNTPVLHVNGTQFDGASDEHRSASALEVISILRQELLQSRAETQKVTENLNCLIALIKRAWTGEKSATLHLANIVGATISDAGGKFGNLAASGYGKTRSVCNWERLAMKLLEKEYKQVQADIKQRQMMYLENRNRYMEEVMSSHYEDMSRVAITRKCLSASSTRCVDDVDQSFLNNFGKSGLKSRRPPSGHRLSRSKSAGVQRSKAVTFVEKNDVTLRELVVHPNAGIPNNPISDMITEELVDGDPDRQTVNDRYFYSYDDPNRYTQNNLFNTGGVRTQKSRPISASALRQKDELRARPKSASVTNTQVYIYHKGERPLKYETTRPVSGSSIKRRERRHSWNDRQSERSIASGHLISESELMAKSAALNTQTQVEAGEVREQKVPEEPTLEQLEAQARAAAFQKKIRKVTQRPKCVDKFSKELLDMDEMEKQFRQSTIQLQKKLGIDGKGLLF